MYKINTHLLNITILSTFTLKSTSLLCVINQANLKCVFKLHCLYIVGILLFTRKIILILTKSILTNFEFEVMFTGSISLLLISIYPDYQQFFDIDYVSNSATEISDVSSQRI